MNRIGISTLAVILISAISLAGCSGSQEDVRVSYCKELTTVLLKSSQSPVWTSNEKRFQRPEYVAVKVLFEMQDKTAGEAVCYYDYDAVDETALTHSQPLSAYSTVPYQMELNGTLVDQHKMHKTILGQQQQLFDKFVASLLQIVNDLLGRSN